MCSFDNGQVKPQRKSGGRKAQIRKKGKVSNNNKSIELKGQQHNNGTSIQTKLDDKVSLNSLNGCDLDGPPWIKDNPFVF